VRGAAVDQDGCDVLKPCVWLDDGQPLGRHVSDRGVRLAEKRRPDHIQVAPGGARGGDVVVLIPDQDRVLTAHGHGHLEVLDRRISGDRDDAPAHRLVRGGGAQETRREPVGGHVHAAR
jgi:hypothetical protein